MENLWITFAFLSASIMATLALFDKVVLDRRLFTPNTTTSLSAFSMFGFFIFTGMLSERPGWIPYPSVDALLIAVAISLGVLYLIYLGTYFKGLDHTDVSRFLPILSTDIILVTALGFVFLGESFHVMIYLGVFVIFAGALMISMEDITQRFTLSSKEGLYYGSMVVISGAVLNLLLKVLTGGMSMVTILFWLGTGGIIALLTGGAVRALMVGQTKTVNYLQTLMTFETILILVRGTVIGTYFFTLTKALQTGPVSLVIAIVKMQVFLVFFGVIVLSELTPEVLEEHMTWTTMVQKFCATSFIVAGVVLIQVYSS